MPTTHNTVIDASELLPKGRGIVLDTNVVLDWLVFRNVACTHLAKSLSTKSVRWLASKAMRAELAHVLSRGICDAWSPDHDAVWASWSRFAVEVEPVAAAGAASRVRCTDEDDQKFVDLALAHRASWLLSRDRAVLKLAQRVHPLGLDILTPEAWSTEVSAR